MRYTNYKKKHHNMHTRLYANTEKIALDKKVLLLLL